MERQPFTDPSLLQVEHARIGVRVISLLRKKWYFSEITIHHAVAQIRVDANGNNNLPKPQQSSSSKNGVQTLFDLAIRHAVLERGEIYYNDRKSALDADLHDVTLNSDLPAVHAMSIPGRLRIRMDISRARDTSPFHMR